MSWQNEEVDALIAKKDSAIEQLRAKLDDLERATQMAVIDPLRARIKRLQADLETANKLIRANREVMQTDAKEVERLQAELQREKRHRELLWLSSLEQEAEFVDYLLTTSREQVYCELTGQSMQEFEASRARMKQLAKTWDEAAELAGKETDTPHDADVMEPVEPA